MNEHYEIFYKDVDPDSGEIVANIPLALTYKESYAKQICKALEKIEYEPNRDFYYKKLEKVKI
jgi:hypothetical protein